MIKKQLAELTPVEKKIIIAKDVLKQIKIGRFKATRGVYVDMALSNKKKINSHRGESLQPLLKTVKKCQVCAIGSVLVSYVDRFNEVNVPPYGVSDMDRMLAIETLRGIISQAELSIMEEDFEHNTRRTTYGHGINLAPAQALTAIMKKLIKLKGQHYEQLSHYEIQAASRRK